MIDFEPPLFNLPKRALRRLRAFAPLVDAAQFGYDASAWAVEQGGYISGSTSLDLFTPEIRLYEQSALVGIGGMRI